MKKQIGIWLDFRKAYIIELYGKKAKVAQILSAIDPSHPKGGARSQTPYGPMDKISESTYLARRKHQEKAYYRKLMQVVQAADELYLFGPAEAKTRLAKTIQADLFFHPQLVAVERADSMTRNQKVARVRSFFNGQTS